MAFILLWLFAVGFVAAEEPAVGVFDNPYPLDTPLAIPKPMVLGVDSPASVEVEAPDTAINLDLDPIPLDKDPGEISLIGDKDSLLQKDGIQNVNVLKMAKQIRRQARMRREYLYRKSLEEKQRQIADRKEKVKRALDENTEIPNELRETALDLQKSLDWDDKGGEGLTSSIDDEYRWAGVEDPKIVITTSRDPSSKLKQFAKELRLIFPNSQRINRGNYEVKQLMEACRANDVTDFIVVHETRGEPDGLIVCHLPFGPTASFTLLNTVMRHDVPNLGTVSEAYPHLVFHNFKSRLGRRVSNILKYLFPVPKEESKRVITFANQDDYISFRHHNYKKVENQIVLKEVGPRFEMKLYEIKLGTLDQLASADVEWSLRPFMNTAKKRRMLSDTPF